LPNDPKNDRSFSHLRRRRTTAARQLIAGDRDDAALSGLFEKSQVKGEASNGGIGNASHGRGSL
jgi:hypothetical protein